MKFWLSLCVATVLLTATQVPASAGIKYLDRVPIIVFAQHRLAVGEARAHRQMIRERRHREALRAKRAAAQAAAEAAASTPTPTTPVATGTWTGGCLSDAQVTTYLLGAGFPSSAVPTMLYYAHRESGNCPGAINSSSGACGLWQIYPCPGPDALDPARNAQLAYMKYSASGFSPWGG